MRFFILCGAALLCFSACSKNPETSDNSANAPATNPSKYVEGLSFLTKSCVALGNDERSCDCLTEQIARNTPEPLLKTYIAMGASEDPDAFVEAEFSVTDASRIFDIHQNAAALCGVSGE